MLKNKVINNAVWIIACRIGQSVLSLIVTMLTARYLGPSNYGLISYVASIIAFIAPMVQLGLGNIQVQELVNHREDEGKIVGTTLVLTTLSALVGYIGLLTFSIIANTGEKETIIVCALYGIMLFLQGAELLQFWFQSRYISKYASIISLIAYIVASIYKIVLLVTGKEIYWYAISNVLDYLIILVGLIIVYYRLNGEKLAFSKIVAKRMVSKSKHYILSNMMIVIFTQTDRIMLKLMLDSASTGFYSAAATCAGLANFVYIAIIDSARPVIFENYKISKQRFEESVSTLYSIIIYLSLFICIVITLFSPYIIYIIYGESYRAAVFPLKIVVWYTTFSYIGSVRNVWILAEGHQKWLWLINLSGAVSNVLLNIILIPIWGICGAAVASLVTQVFSNIVVSFLIRDTRRNTILMIRGLNMKFLISLMKKKY